MEGVAREQEEGIDLTGNSDSDADEDDETDNEE